MIDETVRDHSWSARVTARKFLRQYDSFAHLVVLDYIEDRSAWEREMWLSVLAELDKLYIERDEI